MRRGRQRRQRSAPVRRGGPTRDRRGRGLRGPLSLVPLPRERTRAERFDDLVLDAVEALEERWGDELAEVELAVEDVPPAGPVDDLDPVPLARLEQDGPRASRIRIVVHRRPLELRAEDDEELADLVHDVLVEQVADLLGIDPETVDPDYGLGDR